MNTKIQNIIQEELSVLPKEQQDIINIFEWDKKIEEIGKNYNLTEDEIFNLQIETALALLGLVAPDLYIKNIENNIKINEEKSEKIVIEANQKIFTPMMSQLTDNIKKSLPNRNINWQQNLDFILSGGDYTVFIRRQEKEEPRGKALKFNPSNVEDLRSSFTI